MNSISNISSISVCISDSITSSYISKSISPHKSHNQKKEMNIKNLSENYILKIIALDLFWAGINIHTKTTKKSSINNSNLKSDEKIFCLLTLPSFFYHFA